MGNIFKSKWGNWTDISTGAVHEYRYLLQARRHKNGKLQFRVEKNKDAAWGCAEPNLEQLQQVKYN